MRRSSQEPLGVLCVPDGPCGRRLTESEWVIIYVTTGEIELADRSREKKLQVGQKSGQAVAGDVHASGGGLHELL